ncbi:MAG: glycosyltransferase [bacterium]|nr:glycosyltransferase [bacterium]MDZ4296369.1 glycosyltransferase [Patescibacteria group bacterium]
MQRKVKVCYVVTESEWAGASRYVFDMARHLPEEKFSVTVAAGGRGDILRLLKRCGIATAHLRWLPRTITPWDALAFFEILRLYVRTRPDIIHLNSSKAGFIGSLAAAVYKLLFGYRRRPVVVFTVHGWVFNDPERANWFFRLLERIASYFRDYIICDSEADRRLALRYRIAPEEKLTTVYISLDPEGLYLRERASAREKLGLRPDESPVIGTIANFYPTKGLAYLIEALYLLDKRQTLPQFKAVIIGDGPLRHTLEARIARYNLQGRIHLAGQLPEAAQYLRALDLFVLPSLKEGFPYTLLESLAAGVPIVATAVGGIPEMQAQGGTMTLVPPGDPEALSRAITRTLTGRPRLPAPHSFPDAFHLKRMIAQTLAVYERNLADRLR